MLGGVGPLTTCTRVPAESSRVGAQGPCVPGAHARVKLPGHRLWHHPRHTGHQVVFQRLFPSSVGHLLAIPAHSSCHVAFWFLPTWVPGKTFTARVFCLIMKSNIFSAARGLFGFSRVTPRRDIPGAPWGPVVLFLDLTVQSVVTTGKLLCLLQFVRVLGLAPAMSPWALPVSSLSWLSLGAPSHSLGR